MFIEFKRKPDFLAYRKSLKIIKTTPLKCFQNVYVLENNVLKI